MDSIENMLLQQSLGIDDVGSSINDSSGLFFYGFKLCNDSNYTSLPLCNRSLAMEEYVNVDYSPGLDLTRTIEQIVPIIFGLIVVVGFIGNALVVGVVAANQQMRNTTNLLIINLALADLLFIVFCVPFTGTDYVLPFWPFGDVWCKIVQYLIVVTMYASVYTLVLMSLDRFLAVVHPIASMGIRTERNTYIAIAITWFVILVACVPTLEAHGEVMYIYAGQHFTVCVFLRTEGRRLDLFQIAIFATSYVIPLLLICGLYLRMLMRLWRGTTPGGRVSAESRRGKKRVTRMVIVVVVIFAVCWCPIQLLLVLKSLDIYSQTSAVIMLQIAAHCLAYMNSCVNPILYAFLSENFRKAFRKFFYCNPLVNASATTVANEQRGTTNGQPNNNAEKSKQRQSLYATNVNDITQMTLLKSNELELEAEHDAVDIL